MNLARAFVTIAKRHHGFVCCVCAAPTRFWSLFTLGDAVRALVYLLALVLLAPGCRRDRSGSDAPDVPSTDAAVADVGETDPPVEEVVERDGVDDDTDSGVVCIPEPTPAALLPSGAVEGEVAVGLGGRGLGAPGATLELGGQPFQVALSPDGATAYVVSRGRGLRRLFVTDVATQTLLQEIDADGAHYGIAVAPDGSRVYLSGGPRQELYEYAVNDDRSLTLASTTALGWFTSGLHLEGERLFAGVMSGNRFLEIDVTRLGGDDEAVVGLYTTRAPVWDVVVLGEVRATSSLQGDGVEFFDASGESLGVVETGRAPMGMAASSDLGTLWVAVSGADRLVEIDVGTRSIRSDVDLSSLPLAGVGLDGLDRLNPNDVALSADGSRLYLTLGAANAVAVFEREGLAFAGALPTAWYPTGVTVSPAEDALLIAEAKGFGSGPDGGENGGQVIGSLSHIDLATLDLDATTELLRSQLARPRDVFPFECLGFFPVPTSPEQVSPIEHVVLIVKENKTFDCLFSDMDDLDIDVDPTLLRWGGEITPNLQALARQFNLSNNFYDEVDNSDTGHITLTAGHMNDYVERVWLTSDEFFGYQLTAEATPEDGNFFTHALDHDVSIGVYGEIVGMFQRAADGTQPIEFSDLNYPGGPAYTMNARDSARGEYIVERINEGELAQFTYVLMPNDHTGGTAPGNPTPEAEVADNDEGLGILIDGLSHSPFWEKTAVFVVQDDPQGCTDHVDAHRVFTMVISPWARRGYVSNVNYNFQSVFATIEAILGLPPMGVNDAVASPMWDFFTTEPDFTPYNALPRTVPFEKILDIQTPGARESMAMDFRGPDRNEELGTVIDNYRLWRMGRLTRDEAQANIEAGIRALPDGVARSSSEGQKRIEEGIEEREEEAEEEVFAYDIAWQRYRAWREEEGLPPVERYGAPYPAEVIEGVMNGTIPVESLRRPSD